MTLVSLMTGGVDDIVDGFAGDCGLLVPRGVPFGRGEDETLPLANLGGSVLGLDGGLASRA